MESLWGSRDSWKERRSCFLKIENLDNEVIFFPIFFNLELACTWEDTKRCMNLLFHLNQKKYFYYEKMMWHYSANLSMWYRIRSSQMKFSGPCSVNSEYLKGQRFPTLFGPLLHLTISMVKKICSEIPLFLPASKASHPSTEKSHSSEKSLSLPSSCIIPLWVLFFRLKKPTPTAFPHRPCAPVLHQLGDFPQTWSRMSALTRNIASVKFNVCW